MKSSVAQNDGFATSLHIVLLPFPGTSTQRIVRDMAASLAPGDVVLGKYRVERVIGQGGMGMVVAARHTALGELFAIKLMLNADGPAGQQAFDRFLREARICASLKGEHVVKVQDVGELEDGRPYMVMEYLEGQDLGSVIEKRGPQSVANSAAIVLQACEALSEAHHLGIIHRDVKPPNMFLVRNHSGKVRLKLLDFGISKRVHADTKALTATGAMMGSPLYMSPEQLTDPRAVGPQTDIWAMGVVLYELVTGKVPFDGEMIFQVIQEILNKTPALPSEVRPGLPVEVDKIVVKALRKDPAQRYATIQEFARDVRQLLQANSVIDSNMNLSASAEPDVNIEIESVTFDALSFGPTVEVSSDNVAEAAGPVSVKLSEKAATNGSSAKGTGAGVSTVRSSSTQSDLTQSVSDTKSSKGISPIVLGIGAVALLALSGGGVFLLQGNARSATTDIGTSPESRGSTAPVVTPAPPPAPPPNTVATPLPTASSAPATTPASSAAPPATTSAPAPLFGKSKPATTASAAAAPTTTATTTNTAKHEGLY